MRGKFIVIEGQGFTGKTTQANLLVSKLKENGIETISLRHPGGTPRAEKLRQELLTKKDAGKYPEISWATTYFGEAHRGLPLRLTAAGCAISLNYPAAPKGKIPLQSPLDAAINLASFMPDHQLGPEKLLPYLVADRVFSRRLHDGAKQQSDLLDFNHNQQTKLIAWKAYSLLRDDGMRRFLDLTQTQGLFHATTELITAAEN